jgi:hypothetical protein
MLYLAVRNLDEFRGPAVGDPKFNYLRRGVCL